MVFETLRSSSKIISGYFISIAIFRRRTTVGRVYNFHSGNASCTSEEVMSIDQAAAQPPDPPEEGVIPQPGPVTVYVMLAVRSLKVIAYCVLRMYCTAYCVRKISDAAAVQ